MTYSLTLNLPLHFLLLLTSLPLPLHTSLTLPLTLSLTYSFSHTGKSKDTLELSELSAPLLDVVMSPGQILYVPAGFPHTTGKIPVEFTKMSCTVCHRIKSVSSCGIFWGWSLWDGVLSESIQTYVMSPSHLLTLFLTPMHYTALQTLWTWTRRGRTPTRTHPSILLWGWTHTSGASTSRPSGPTHSSGQDWTIKCSSPSCRNQSTGIYRCALTSAGCSWYSSSFSSSFLFDLLHVEFPLCCISLQNYRIRLTSSQKLDVSAAAGVSVSVWCVSVWCVSVWCICWLCAAHNIRVI